MGSHLTHRQMVFCIIYSRPRTLIGHTFADARTQAPQSLNESAAHPPRGPSARAASLPAPPVWLAAELPPPHFLPGRALGPQILRSPPPPHWGHCPETLPPQGMRSPEKAGYPSPSAKPPTPAPDMSLPRSQEQERESPVTLGPSLLELPSPPARPARDRCVQSDPTVIGQS